MFIAPQRLLYLQQTKAVPITYRGKTAINEPQLPELEISAQMLFDRAGLLGQ